MRARVFLCFQRKLPPLDGEVPASGPREGGSEGGVAERGRQDDVEGRKERQKERDCDYARQVK